MQDFFLYGVPPPPRARLKLFLFNLVFLENKYGNVDGALKFTQNDIINF